jgi:hypothetical protein
MFAVLYWCCPPRYQAMYLVNGGGDGMRNVFPMHSMPSAVHDARP